jgi:hypothetical protein
MFSCGLSRTKARQQAIYQSMESHLTKAFSAEVHHKPRDRSVVFLHPIANLKYTDNNMHKYRAILNRVGLVLLAVGIADIAYMVYLNGARGLPLQSSDLTGRCSLLPAGYCDQYKTDRREKFEESSMIK